MKRFVRIPVTAFVLLIPIIFCAIYSTDWYRTHWKKALPKYVDSDLLPGKQAVLVIMLAVPVLAVSLAGAALKPDKVWTFSIPLGLHAPNDLIGLFLWFLVQFSWITTRYLRDASFGITLGLCAMVSLQAILLPVSKASPFLSVLKLAPENAVRFHRFLGWTTFWFISGHAAWFIFKWSAQGTLVEKVLSWQGHIPILPGALAILVLFPLFATSVSWIRMHWSYELFLYIHRCCSFVFALCVALHFPGIIWWCLPSLLLYFADQTAQLPTLFQFVQVKRVRSASGVLSLTLPYPSGMSKLEPLQWVSIQVPRVSLLQWHPFTVAHSTEDEFSVTLKIVHGGWTDALNQHILRTPEAVMRIGGPYGVGFELQDYGEDVPLFMVAGGSGGTPFTALIQALSQRYVHGKDTKSLPPMQLVWVLKSQEHMIEFVQQAGVNEMVSKIPSLCMKLYVTSTPDSALLLEGREVFEADFQARTNSQIMDPELHQHSNSCTVVLSHVLIPLGGIIGMRHGIALKANGALVFLYLLIGAAVAAMVLHTSVFLLRRVHVFYKRKFSDDMASSRQLQLTNTVLGQTASSSGSAPCAFADDSDADSSIANNDASDCFGSISHHTGRPCLVELLEDFELQCKAEQQSAFAGITVLASGPSGLLSDASSAAHSRGYMFQSLSFNL